MNPKKLLVALFSLFIISWPSLVDAGRGCCSYHGGQDYCSSTGHWMCNDGTQSPTCTCSYTPPVTEVKTPPPLVPLATKTEPVAIKSIDDTKGGLVAMLMLDNTINLLFSWTAFPNVDGYSTYISEDENSIPDSTIDTNKPEFTFKNVKPGKYFIFIKGHQTNGKWTKSINWDFNVPSIAVEPTPVKEETKEIQPTDNPTRTPAEIITGLVFTVGFLAWTGGFPILSFVLWRKKKKLETEMQKLREKLPIEPLTL